MGASAGPASGSLGATGARGADATGPGGGGLLLPQPATTNEVAAASTSALALIAGLRWPAPRERAGRADRADPAWRSAAARPPDGTRMPRRGDPPAAQIG